ncbi:MAG: FAD:protein FMN transferase [Thermodesulfobacteriota bacterium]
MGTFVTVIVVCPDPEQAKHSVDMAFREIQRVADLMNVRKADSEVSQLNRNGFHDHLSSDTRTVIQRANYFSELSGGAFDLTVLPLLSLWENHAARHSVPNEEELSRALELVDYRNIKIHDKHVSFAKEGMGITLAGIAKGYAVDRAIEVLRQNGIRRALVNGGGDIRTLGRKTDNQPWDIGLLDPRSKSAFLTRIQLSGQAIATSGAYRRSLNDLLDPRSGKPARDVISSTIVTGRAMDADVLATAFLVLGSTDGMALLNRFGGAEALYVTKEGYFFRNGSEGVGTHD